MESSSRDSRPTDASTSPFVSTPRRLRVAGESSALKETRFRFEDQAGYLNGHLFMSLYPEEPCPICRVLAVYHDRRTGWAWEALLGRPIVGHINQDGGRR